MKNRDKKRMDEDCRWTENLAKEILWAEGRGPVGSNWWKAEWMDLARCFDKIFVEQFHVEKTVDLRNCCQAQECFLRLRVTESTLVKGYGELKNHFFLVS